MSLDNQFLNDPYRRTPGAATDQETLPLDVIIRRAFDSLMLDVHTCMPAVVTRVRSTGFVDVQPTMRRVYSDGTTVDLPQVQNALLAMPSGADYWIRLPVAVGDSGLAIFSERSLDVWSVDGGVVDPLDARHHDLADVIFLPGLRPASSPIPGTSSDMVLHNGAAEIYLQKAGRFRIKNETNELLSRLVQLVQDLIDAEVDTSGLMAGTDPVTGGPAPLTAGTISALEAVKAQLETLEGA